MNQIRNQLFYTLKPLIPRPVQIFLRRQIAQHMRRKNGYLWPIDPNAAKPPEGWPGWPDGKQFALVLSHDVDTPKGYNDVLKLADIEEELGFRSQFNFVPERYGVVDVRLLDELKRRGFGIGVHGLKHDGKLFSSKKIFDERAPRINAYLKKWGTRGFTTPSMIRNHDWMHALDIDHCVSTFDTDPFEPQPDAVGTIFPFWVPNSLAEPWLRGAALHPAAGFDAVHDPAGADHRYLDSETGLGCGKRRHGAFEQPPGLHGFRGRRRRFDYPVSHYIDFLTYLKTRYAGMYYHALPAEIADVCRQRDRSLNTRSAGRRALPLPRPSLGVRRKGKRA